MAHGKSTCLVCGKSWVPNTHTDTHAHVYAWADSKRNISLLTRESKYIPYHFLSLVAAVVWRLFHMNNVKLVNNSLVNNE